ncbi:MAG: hypothetical protein HRU38_00070 [Saccharospirillaceae bacterium]|nr:hypothetical protein [Pseudomonadales bacterium]NRB77057.1 hypothetical protein [Saccharospirillaceae bacterium]
MSEIKKAQINLYNQADLDNKVSFNFRYMLRFCFIVFILTMLWNVYLVANLFITKNTTQQLFITQQKSYNDLIRYQQEFPNKQNSIHLTQNLEEMQSVYAQKKQVLDALNFSESTSFDGFYLYFEGLANADINQLWLTSFSFANSMDSMQINGVAKKASLVTSYLKSLQHTVFSGSTFDDVSITPYAPNVDAIKFELSTKNSQRNLSQLTNQKNTIIDFSRSSSIDVNSNITEQISDRLIGGGND